MAADRNVTVSRARRGAAAVLLVLLPGLAALVPLLDRGVDVRPVVAAVGTAGHDHSACLQTAANAPLTGTPVAVVLPRNDGARPAHRRPDLAPHSPATGLHHPRAPPI